LKRYIIDTNVLISFVTDRNPEQQQKIATLFEAAAHLKAAILCHQYVLTEFIYVMDKVYHLPKNEIGRMAADLIQMPGIEVVQECDFAAVLACWPDPLPDFSDAVIASVGMSRRGALVVTFDRKFAGGLKSLGLGIYTFEP
jgi:predicted nucleic-acid-binding protein